MSVGLHDVQGLTATLPVIQEVLYQLRSYVRPGVMMLNQGDMPVPTMISDPQPLVVSTTRSIDHREIQLQSASAIDPENWL